MIVNDIMYDILLFTIIIDSSQCFSYFFIFFKKIIIIIFFSFIFNNLFINYKKNGLFDNIY